MEGEEGEASLLNALYYDKKGATFLLWHEESFGLLAFAFRNGFLITRDWMGTIDHEYKSLSNKQTNNAAPPKDSIVLMLLIQTKSNRKKKRML